MIPLFLYLLHQYDHQNEHCKRPKIEKKIDITFLLIIRQWSINVHTTCPSISPISSITHAAINKNSDQKEDDIYHNEICQPLAYSELCMHNLVF